MATVHRGLSQFSRRQGLCPWKWPSSPRKWDCPPRPRFRWQAVLALTAVLGVAPEVPAQRPVSDPHIGYLYPAGGRTNSVVEVVVGGQALKGTTEAYISGGGARVSVVKYYKHLTRGEAMGIERRLRDARARLQEMRKKTPTSAKRPRLTQAEIVKEARVTEEQLELLADYRRRAADPKRQLNPQLLEEVTLHVKLGTDAKPGERELRLVTPQGMSSPIWFMVGQFPEYREVEPNDITPNSQVHVELPAVINGQIMPGDVDRFAFKARKGARLVASASARELIPYIADAVPGWFQAVLALYDENGREVAYAGEYGWRQDPVLFCEIPRDGQYVLEIWDAIYRGREDFVYRITVGELPFVTNIFPLGARAGTQVTLDLAGWNLPTDKLKMEAFYDRARPIRSISLRQQERAISNRVPFAVDMQSECLDQEPNDRPEEAQAVALPMIVNGRIDKPGDRDVFKFEGRVRETVVAEVYARRLNSPMDSQLRLTDQAGKELAFNDDYVDLGLALSTHHADSRLSVTLPANGTYYVHLSDAQRKGGREYAYRLQIRPPRPDFELRVVPSSVIARVATSVPITVHALRRDGFADDILLQLENAPPGFKLDGAWLPAGLDKIRLTLTVPPTPTPEPISFQLEGHATSHSRRISRLAVPAEDMMQAFFYRHLVPVKDWAIAVTGRAGAKPPVQLAREERLRLLAGGTAQLRATAPGKPPAEIRVELSEPPDGFSVQKVSAEGDGVAVVVYADAAKVKAGQKGNLIFNVFSEQPILSEGKPTGRTRRTPVGLLPAVPFEIVSR